MKVLWFVVHQILSSAVVTLLSPLLLGYAFWVASFVDHEATQRRARFILTEVPYAPTQFVVGFILGLLVFKLTRQHMMFWVWILPLGFLGWTIYLFRHTISPSFIDFWTLTCPPARNCVYRIDAATPMISSLGYVLGALLGCRISNRKDKTKADRATSGA